MNVSFTKMLRIISRQIVLLLLPLCLFAQPNKPFDSYNVITGTTFHKDYTTAGTTVIIQAPQHAQSYSLSNSGSNYTFNYTPNSTYLGKDYVVIEYYPVYPGVPSYLSLELVVTKSVVTTKTDYITINKNQSANIAVLDNDETTSPGLTLSANFPYVMHGIATPINGNHVSFLPDYNFTGVANVNYIACDAMNTCKMGSVVIKVIDSSMPVYDTLRYSVKKSGNIDIQLGLGGYTAIVQYPTQGGLNDISLDLVKYTPNSPYVGTDLFTYSNIINGVTHYKTVIVYVFNTTNSNKYAIDDYAATPKNKPVTLNLLANDIGTYTILYPNLMTSPNGTIQYLGSGNVKFTPNNNFTGTASFKYKVGFPGYAPIETGNVTIDVSDQIPVSNTFNLVTLKAKPLVIKYAVPFSNWTFALDDPA
ncbi:MAG TPA: Ig-like domain-containing protein, partial [Saprospiraceae bacterium]|nr:Ig-like domain-containing protein [Saprospiraceae bacterium]